MAASPLLVFPFGETLSNPGNSDSGVNAEIKIGKDTTGTINSAVLTVTIPIDPRLFRVVPPDGQGEYKLAKNEVGFASTDKMYLPETAQPKGGNALSVTFTDQQGFLNLQLALAEPKRDYGN
ncbi:hypothetical protein [Mucilaginibacter rubeus]|uniref:hypothetical protein n=1 Tax=Mucilaginibacter rubeus TaxID=2027860 RepID=UPI00166D9485|nr:hypothetical protein [Mucilaginibacter rubeus]GGB17897.1 hypothetical protein GCM10011500_37370 [Mucilaginibacter rubeus]